MELAKLSNVKTGTRTLFEELYGQVSLRPYEQHGNPKEQAHERCLRMLAVTLGRELTPMAVTGYLAVLDAFSKDEAILAFTAAMNECDFFPVPKKLQELSGRSERLDARSLRELLDLAGVLRDWPMLQPKAGEILNEGRDPVTDRYLPLSEVQRGPMQHPPALTDFTLRTLTALGDGDIPAGLRRITPAVPGLLGKLGDDQSFELRQADSVKRAWLAAYRTVAL